MEHIRLETQRSGHGSWLSCFDFGLETMAIQNSDLVPPFRRQENINWIQTESITRIKPSSTTTAVLWQMLWCWFWKLTWHACTFTYSELRQHVSVYVYLLITNMWFIFWLDWRKMVLNYLSEYVSHTQFNKTSLTSRTLSTCLLVRAAIT